MIFGLNCSPFSFRIGSTSILLNRSDELEILDEELLEDETLEELYELELMLLDELLELLEETEELDEFEDELLGATELQLDSWLSPLRACPELVEGSLDELLESSLSELLDDSVRWYSRPSAVSVSL